MKSLNSLLKPLAKHLYMNIGSATRWKSKSNMTTVEFTVYTVHPLNLDGSIIDQIDVEINLTTYANKLRVEIIELTPLERTLAFYIYTPERAEDFKYMKSDILNKLQKCVLKHYPELEDTIL